MAWPGWGPKLEVSGTLLECLTGAAGLVSWDSSTLSCTRLLLIFPLEYKHQRNPSSLSSRGAMLPSVGCLSLTVGTVVTSVAYRHPLSLEKGGKERRGGTGEKPTY